MEIKGYVRSNGKVTEDAIRYADEIVAELRHVTERYNLRRVLVVRYWVAIPGTVDVQTFDDRQYTRFHSGVEVPERAKNENSHYRWRAIAAGARFESRTRKELIEKLVAAGVVES